MSKTTKQKSIFTLEQKHDYAKLMLHENYTNKQIMEISGAASSTVSKWKKQYQEELGGKTPSGNAFTSAQQEIQTLKAELWRAKRDNDILKKAAAIFIKDSPST